MRRLPKIYNSFRHRMAVLWNPAWIDKGGLQMAVVILAVFLVYVPVLKNSFVWDDYFVAAKNDFITSVKNVPRLFQKSYLTKSSDLSLAGFKDIGSGESSYRPVATVTFFFDYILFKRAPWGYHLHNLLLHLVNTVLVYLFVRRLTAFKMLPFWAALFFGFHPVHVEAVAGIANREDLLVFFFGLISFLYYLKSGQAEGRNQRGFYAVSLAMFFFALFSKEMAVVFPVLFLGYDFFYQEKSGGLRSVFWVKRKHYAGYCVILGFYLAVRFGLLVMDAGGVRVFSGESGLTRLFSILWIFALYVQWLLIPLGIRVVIPEDQTLTIVSFFSVPVFVSLAVIAALIMIAVKMRQTAREITFGILWFFAALLPVLNIIPLTSFMASRYLYLPSFGMILACVSALTRWSGSLRDRLGSAVLMRGFVFLGIGVLLIFAGLVRAEIRNWRDNLSFGQYLARLYPREARIRCILGTYYDEAGFPEKARAEYEASLEINPRYAKANFCLGRYYHAKGDEAVALGFFLKTIEDSPDFWQAHFYLGNIYLSREEYALAKAHYVAVLMVIPRWPPALNNLGVAYFKTGDAVRARKLWEAK